MSSRHLLRTSLCKDTSVINEDSISFSTDMSDSVKMSSRSVDESFQEKS